MAPRSVYGLLLLILLGFLRPSLAKDWIMVSYTCFNESYYEEGDTFKTNLDVLLQYLLSNTPATLFSKTIVGDQSTNSTVYGLMQCRNDLTADDCLICNKNASIAINQRCPKSRSAAIWFDACFIHYSPKNFFGKFDSSYKVIIADTNNPSDNSSSSLFWQPGYLVGNLINSATSDSSLRLFDVGSYPVSDSQTIYGLVQCSRDLTMSDCSSCLKNLAQSFPNQFDTKREFSIMTTTCIIWIGFQKFYITRPLPAGKGSSTIKVTIAVIVSVVSVVLLAALSVFIICRRRKKKEPQGLTENDLREMRLLSEATSATLGADYDLPFICLSTVRAATSNFSDYNMLGKGGYGPVYRGELIGGQRIAVKRLSKGSGQGMEEFKNEVMLIAKLQHRNLVKLLGCCIENEERLLIYEYMPNGSLDKLLFDEKHCGQLDWKKRVSIITGFARGLLYLHQDSRLRIIHRDLKAGNILLDNDMNPKISDFGLARTVGGNEDAASTRRIYGTYGYMAPEYANQGLFSIKSDVFSFGVVMLEIIAGRKNSFYKTSFIETLSGIAWTLWCEERGKELIDPHLEESVNIDEAVRCINIALLCIQEDAAARPTMSSVLFMLKSDSPLPKPMRPAFYTRENENTIDQLEHELTSTSAHASSSNQVTLTTVVAR